MSERETVLRVEDLGKVYRTRRGTRVTAADGVTFSAGAGEIVGLLGANGAGKTTTIKCICTLVRPTRGRIEIAGFDVVRQPRKAVAKVAAVLEGNRNIYWRMTVRENIEFFGALHGRSKRSVAQPIDELLALLSLEDKRDIPARHLSRGMQQKLAVACCLVKDTPLVLLDEPTLGLDVETSRGLRAYLRQLGDQGRTVLLSSHDMGVIEDLCERVIVLKEGRVITDDTVVNLLELFKARAYRFELSGSLTSFQESELHARFTRLEIAAGAERTYIDVQLEDSHDIYDLIGILQQGGTVIESIDRRDPDLEEIFLRMITDKVREEASERIAKTRGAVHS